MISITSLCYSRPKELSITLPLWLAQRDVDFEICLGVGPEIKLPDDPRIRAIPISGKWTATTGLVCAGFNQVRKQARGEVLLITYCDIMLLNPRQLRKMLDVWEPEKIITEQMPGQGGYQDRGIWNHCMMVGKKLVEHAGGWDEFYDGGHAYEDSDFASGLVKAGGVYHIFRPSVPGITHIKHPRREESENITPLYCRNKSYYHRKWPESIMEMDNRGAFKHYD